MPEQGSDENRGCDEPWESILIVHTPAWLSTKSACNEFRLVNVIKFRCNLRFRGLQAPWVDVIRLECCEKELNGGYRKNEVRYGTAILEGSSDIVASLPTAK